MPGPRATFANAPTPGLTRRANAPQLPGGGGDWAQVELTDALINTTTQLGSLKLKTLFKVIPEEKQQQVQEKDADNIRKVLFKSFIQWF